MKLTTRQINLAKGKPIRTLLAPTEAQIQRTICDWLGLVGVPYTVSDASLVTGSDGKPRRKVSTPGWPDITACLNGRLWAIECKTLTGRLRDSQRAVLKQLADNGALITIARCLEDVVRDYNLR